MVLENQHRSNLLTLPSEPLDITDDLADGSNDCQAVSLDLGLSGDFVEG
jgi:hypothetical protein